MKGRGYKTITTDWEYMYKEAKKELLAADAHIAKYNQIIDGLEADNQRLREALEAILNRKSDYHAENVRSMKYLAKKALEK